MNIAIIIHNFIGTACKIKFIYNKKSLDLYESCNGQPHVIGKDLLVELFDVMNKFRGDVSVACEEWGQMIQYSHMSVVCDYFSQLSEKLYCFRSSTFNGKLIMERLFSSNSSNENMFLHHTATTTFKSAYEWVIDLDNCLFSGSNTIITRTFPLKQIYRLLLDETTRRNRTRSWVSEMVNSFRPETRTPDYFSHHFSALLIQKAFRRYCCMLLELQPGKGILFLLAQKRFQEKV